jgi:hypothetical protein
MQLHPDIPRGQIQLSPTLPDRLLPLRVENVPLAGARLDISVDSDGAFHVTGLPSGVRLVNAQHPRP